MRADPLLERRALAGDGVPALVKAVVTLVVTMSIGREGPSGNAANCGQRPAWQNAGVWPGFEVVHDLFHGDDGFLRRQYSFFLHAENTPQQNVSFAVGLLCVNDGHVGLDRRYRGKGFAGEGTFDKFDLLVVLGKIGAGIGPQHCEGQFGGSGHVGIRQVSVAVFLNFERPGPVVLDGVTKTVQGTDAGVSTPGKNELFRAAGSDQLIVDHVRSHAHQRELSPLLPNDFVSRRERNQVRESLHRHGVAVAHQRSHCFPESRDVSHGDGRPCV